MTEAKTVIQKALSQTKAYMHILKQLNVAFTSPKAKNMED